MAGRLLQSRRWFHADYEVGDVAIQQSFDAESIATGPISLDRWMYSINSCRQAMKLKAAIRADLGHLVVPGLVGPHRNPHARRYRRTVAQHYASFKRVGCRELDISD